MAATNSEQSIFLAALDLSTPAERSAYLKGACGNDPILLANVEALLATHEKGDDFLERPPVNATAAYVPVSERPGSIIGPYKLLEQIGEGGMGLVFVAEQQQPVRRKVALKIIKPGMDSAQVIARFEAERQALAMMDHQNIAKVYEAGTTSTGRPFFVMELVHGIPITDYCDASKLTPRQRLELFVPVCHAIQHAHQKGIIHRDIKPSNVLVTMYEDRPVPKVIDFGVAKAIEQRLTERTVYTQFGTMVGTFEYMSPEQAEMSAFGVDTRSDIYSLGVLMYELLTGSTPLERPRIREAAFDEIRRIIREEEPPRPSVRLSTSGMLPKVAAARQTEPAKLSRLVRGELDWIVMKALEKDRRRRYETANGFAMDVLRYLSDEQVLACPPTVGYRVRKFARRNFRLLAAATAFAVLLVTATVVSLSLAAWARRAEADSRQALEDVKQEQQKTLAALERESAARKRSREILARISDRIVEETFSRKAQFDERDRQFLRQILKDYESLAAETGDSVEARELRAEGNLRVGILRFKLGEMREAEAAYRASLQILVDLVRDGPMRSDFRLELASCRHELAALLIDTGRLKEAEAMCREALSVRERLAAEAPSPTHRMALAASHYQLGLCLDETGRVKEAEVAYNTSLMIVAAVAKEFPNDPNYQMNLAATHGHLAALLDDMGRGDDADTHYRKALDIQTQLVRQHPEVGEFRQRLAGYHNNLGVKSQNEGRLEDAERQYRAAYQIQVELAAQFPAVPEHRRLLAMSHYNLSVVLRARGKLEEADAAHQSAQELLRRLADEFPTVPEFQHVLAERHQRAASRLSELGKLKESEAEYRAAIEIDTRLAARFPSAAKYRELLGKCQVWLGDLLYSAGRWDESDRAYREALATHRKLVEDFPTAPSYHSNLASLHNNYSLLQKQAGDMRAAEDSLREALAIQSKLAQEFSGKPRYRLALAKSNTNLGLLLEQTGRLNQAEQFHRIALEIDEKLVAEFPNSIEYRRSIGLCLNNVGIIDRLMGRAKEAEAAHLTALKHQSRLVDEHPVIPDFRQDLARTYMNLGNLYANLKRYQDAEANLDLGLEVLKKLVAEFPDAPDYRQMLASMYNNRGVAFRKAGQYDRVEAELRAAIEFQTKMAAEAPLILEYRSMLAKSYWNLAELRRLTNRFQDSETELRKAIEIQSRLVADAFSIATFRDILAEMKNELGNLLRLGRRFDEAEKNQVETTDIVRKLVADFPHQIGFRNKLAGELVNLAIGRMDQKRYVEALNLLNEAVPHHQAALQGDPDYAHFRSFWRNNRNTMCLILLAMSDHVELEKAGFELADVKYQPAHDAIDGSSFLFRSIPLIESDEKLSEEKRKDMARRRADQALQLLHRASDVRDNSATQRLVRAFYDLGNEFFRQTRFEQACDCMRRVIGIDPKIAEAHINLGVALEKLHRYDESIASFRAAIELKQLVDVAHFYIGQTYAAQHKAAEAIAAYRKSIELKPNNAETNAYLSWWLATATDPNLRDVKTAIAHARKSTELKPESKLCWGNLGVALWSNGEWKEAVSVLEKADRLDKDGDGFHRFFLAMSYWHIGEKEKARTAFNEGTAWMGKNEPKGEELLRFRNEAAKLMNEDSDKTRR